jgi:hypothetical protein
MNPRERSFIFLTLALFFIFTLFSAIAPAVSQTGKGGAVFDGCCPGHSKSQAGTKCTHKKSGCPHKKTSTAAQKGKIRTLYTCPMKEHADVVQEKPGKCPKCGMQLVKKQFREYYECPMKQDKYTSDKPGKCPKCGMNLEKRLVPVE